MTSNTLCRLNLARSVPLALAVGVLLSPVAVHAADPGRLFYTPTQRAQLEARRTGGATRSVAAAAPSAPAAAPVQFDGIVVRSDGRTTTWVNGEARRDDERAANLKPGQVRAGNRVYEPYQVIAPDAVRVVPDRVTP